MKRKIGLGKVTVKHFLNKRNKPVCNENGEPCYTVSYRVVVKSMTITRQSNINNIYDMPFSETTFDKASKEGLFDTEKKLVERIVYKYLSDETGGRVKDFSGCKWYGRSKVAAMNNINAYIDFYSDSISNIIIQLPHIMVAEDMAEILGNKYYISLENILELAKSIDYSRSKISPTIDSAFNLAKKFYDSPGKYEEEAIPMIDFEERKYLFKGWEEMENIFSRPDTLKLLDISNPFYFEAKKK